MKVIQGKTYAKVYSDILRTLSTSSEYITGPRGLQTKEVIDLLAIIENPLENLWQCEARPFPTRYLAGELIWYFGAWNDLDFIKNYSKFWKRIANKDGTLNSAYGHLLFNKLGEQSQWEWAWSSLMKDQDTRQAIMHFNRPEHQTEGNKDFVCTLVGHFMIRDNKLLFSINMRSSDVIRGLTFDVPYFLLLHQQMWKHLKTKYTDLELGQFRILLNSSHVYQEHYDLIDQMLETGIEEDRLPIIDVDLIDPSGKPNPIWSQLRTDLDEPRTNDKLIQWIKNEAK